MILPGEYVAANPKHEITRAHILRVRLQIVHQLIVKLTNHQLKSPPALVIMGQKLIT